MLALKMNNQWLMLNSNILDHEGSFFTISHVKYLNINYLLCCKIEACRMWAQDNNIITIQCIENNPLNTLNSNFFSFIFWKTKNINIYLQYSALAPANLPPPPQTSVTHHVLLSFISELYLFWIGSLVLHKKTIF